jgi:hypothetical protein
MRAGYIDHRRAQQFSEGDRGHKLSMGPKAKKCQQFPWKNFPVRYWQSSFKAWIPKSGRPA